MSTAVTQPALTAVRDAPVGGQAVLEGVMMRGVAHWAVAVRSSHTHTIELWCFSLAPARRRLLLRLPVLRGVAALVESMTIGFRALGIAAGVQVPSKQVPSTQVPSKQVPSKHDAASEHAVASQLGSGGSAGAEPPEVEPAEPPRGVWAVAIGVSLVLAVGLFFVVPVTVTSLVRSRLGSSWLFWLVEGCVRTAIFLAYLALLSRLRDLRRVLEYHGAEHKVIACYEAGDALVPERARLYPRLHPRCGTSFLLVVMIVAIFVFAPVGLPAWWILVLSRIAGVPIVAGVSFEIIRLAGRHRSRRWVRWLMSPGLQLQRLTTREPDLDELTVAIAALETVLERETPGVLTASDLVGLEVVA